MLEQSILQNYLDILREELVPATGCTEPIAIAYCAATLRELLGALPERVDAAVSGNILKNVKSVVVPNTGGRKGIGPAIAVGLVAGDAARDLQVISAVTEEQLAELDADRCALLRLPVPRHSPCALLRLTFLCSNHLRFSQAYPCSHGYTRDVLFFLFIQFSRFFLTPRL